MNSTEILSDLHQEIQMSARDPNKPDHDEVSKAICITINRLYKKLCAMQNNHTTTCTPVSVTFHTSDMLAHHNNHMKIDGSVSIPKEYIEVLVDAEMDQAEINRASAERSIVVDLIVESDQNGNFKRAMTSDIPTQHYHNRHTNDALAKLCRILTTNADEGALNIRSDQYEYILNATRDDVRLQRRKASRIERSERR
jgi:hypothetical protein